MSKQPSHSEKRLTRVATLDAPGPRAAVSRAAIGHEADDALQAATKELLEAGILLNRLTGKERVQ